jgi:hypothetical protein
MALRNLTAEREWRQSGPGLLHTGRHIWDTEHRKMIFTGAIFYLAAEKDHGVEELDRGVGVEASRARLAAHRPPHPRN